MYRDPTIPTMIIVVKENFLFTGRNLLVGGQPSEREGPRQDEEKRAHTAAQSKFHIEM